LAPETNLKDTLSTNIKFLFGPPGTGKTTTLAKRIIQRMENVASPIIVLTPTNKAADVLTKKIIDQHKSVPDWLIRMGNCTNATILDANVVKSENETIVKPNSRVVIITTIHRFQYQKVLISAKNKATMRLCDCAWSQIIFDEASMIPLPYITCAIHQSQRIRENTEFVVAGDPLQIPPVFDLIGDDLEEDDAEELQRQNIYTMIGLNSFDENVQRQIPIYGEYNLIENLTKQHRSVPVIGTLFSKFQYGDRVSHSRGTKNNKRTAISRQLPEYFKTALGFKPITVIRYPVQAGQTIYNPKKLNKSPLHIYSALLISELVKRFRHEIDKEVMPVWSLGILSPYRAQADIISKMIEGHNKKSERLNITTDTVHGFQGDENNIVFAMFNPSSANAYYSRFLKKEYIINVAISRAEDYLVLFIPDINTKGLDKLDIISTLMQIISELPQEHVAYLTASNLEKELMTQTNFFSDNSLTTAHQNVNVYGIPHKQYVIRHSENAIDVHWENKDFIN
jgi:superfamily I DNA and/or RNA helicase